MSLKKHFGMRNNLIQNHQYTYNVFIYNPIHPKSIFSIGGCNQMKYGRRNGTRRRTLRKTDKNRGKSMVKD